MDTFTVRQSRKASLIIIGVSLVLLFGWLMGLSEYEEYARDPGRKLVFVVLYKISIVLFCGGGILGLVSGVRNLVLPRRLVVADMLGLRIYLGMPGAVWLNLPWRQIQALETRMVRFKRDNSIKCLSITVQDINAVRVTKPLRAGLALTTTRDKSTPANELNFNCTHYQPRVEECIRVFQQFHQTLGS